MDGWCENATEPGIIHRQYPRREPNQHMSAASFPISKVSQYVYIPWGGNGGHDLVDLNSWSLTWLYMETIKRG